MENKTNPTKKLLFNALGLAISIIPVTVSIFSYFPIWIAREDASILSGISLILMALAFVPMYKYFRSILRSPSAPVMWLISFILFLLLSRIAHEMTVISFVGLISNLIGSVFFRIAQKGGKAEMTDEGRT